MRADYLNENSGVSDFNNKVKIINADATLVAKDSGSVVLMGANGVDITLPSAEVGLNFNIVLTGDYDTAVCTVVQAAATEDFVGAIYGSTQGEDAGTDGDVAGASNTKITFAAASLAGDNVTLVCDGVKWYVKAYAQNIGAITFDD